MNTTSTTPSLNSSDDTSCGALSKLPAEVRLMIYKLVFGSSETCEWDEIRAFNRLALLHTCRLVRLEALPVFQTTTLRVRDWLASPPTTRPAIPLSSGLQQLELTVALDELFDEDSVRFGFLCISRNIPNLQHLPLLLEPYDYVELSAGFIVDLYVPTTSEEAEDNVNDKQKQRRLNIKEPGACFGSPGDKILGMEDFNFVCEQLHRRHAAGGKLTFSITVCRSIILNPYGSRWSSTNALAKLRAALALPKTMMIHFDVHTNELEMADGDEKSACSISDDGILTVL